MRILSAAFLSAALLCLCSPPLAAADAAAPAAVSWDSFAGMRQELEGQNLELRDELIPAQLAYLDALTRALAGAEALDAEARERAGAWARVEYLLETSFRLLEGSGEYEAFLKATEPLKPAAAPALTVLPFEALDGDGDAAGGLVFTGEDGTRFQPVATEHGLVLVDSDNGTALASQTTIAATPERDIPRDGASYAALVRARAAWLRGVALERLGRTADGAAETAGLGFIRDWAVLGPLDGTGETSSAGDSGIDEIYASLAAPETAAGRQGSARWRFFSSVDPLGRMYPGALFPAGGGRSAFAAALVRSPENMPAVLHFGTGVPSVVCVNNTVAGGTSGAARVWLRKGWNAVLVRGGSGGRSWGMALRLALPDGSPFPGAVARPANGSPAALADFLAEAAAVGRRTVLDRRYRPERPPDADGVSILTQRLLDEPDDARAGFYLASLLVAKRLMEGAERFDREMIFRRAVEDSGGDPFFTLMAARSIDSGMEGPDREENLRLVLLRDVADTGAAAALVDTGRLYLDVMRQPRRAKEYAARALSVNPMSLRAGVLDYDVAVSMGWQPVARRLLTDLVNRHPSAASARLRLGRSALAGGRYRQALTEFHAVLAVDAGGHEALEGAVVALGMLGQTSAAADLLVRHIERFPYDFAMRRKLADLYRTLGRDGDAGRTLAAIPALRGETGGDPDADPDAAGRTERGGSAGLFTAFRQELDLSLPVQEPAGGWEYLYFQVEDRLTGSGAFGRNVSFALRVYTQRAANMLRRLGVWLEDSFASGRIVRLDIVSPDGTRQPFTPPASSAKGGEELQFLLPPLATGMTVEAEIAMRRERVPFLGDYFGHIAPFAQSAPVRLSRYIFVAPRDRRVFFRAANGAPEAMVVPSDDGENITRVWEMSDLPAFHDEPFSPGMNELSPCVQVSSFGDWDEFARWYWNLIGAQYQAPPELALLARTLGEGATSPLAKLDRAAAWIAANIGNRSWEYGPYAFRPVNARSVLSRLSADSKDRTLLLCLLAREYGLEAWPVLSRMRSAAGRSAAFGSGEMELPLLDHFNHSLALVRAPVGGDVLMDAGNPYRPPGVMPSRLFGSPGLTVMPDGADRITVPDDGSAACEWAETAEMTVDADGSILWDEKIAASGTAAQILRQRFAKTGGTENAEAWIAFLASLGAAPSATSDAFADAGEGGASASPASASWEGRARLRQFAGMEEGRVSLRVPALPGSSVNASMPRGSVFPYPLSLASVATLGERRQELLLPHGFRLSRSITVKFPEDWTLVNPELPFRREYPFGTLSMQCEAGTGSVFFRIAADIPGHSVAAEEYAAFREMAALLGRWLSPRLVWERQ